MPLQLHTFPVFEDSGKRFRVEKNEADRGKWNILAAPFPGSEMQSIMCHCFDRDSADAICEAMNVSAEVDEAIQDSEDGMVVDESFSSDAEDEELGSVFDHDEDEEDLNDKDA